MTKLAPAAPARDPIIPIWERLNDVWSYPLKTDPLIVIGIAAVASMLTSFIWLSLVAAVFQLMITAYVYKAGAEILIHTAHGNLEPPTATSRVREGQGWQQVHLVTVFFLMGLIAFWLLPFWLAMVVALILIAGYPAACIQVAVNELIFQALNPLRWFGAMQRIGWPYLGVVLLTLAFAFSRSYLQSYVDAWLWYPIAVLLSAAIAFYFAIASFFMLGYVVYQFHEELGFELDAPTNLPLPTPRGRLDPDQDIIDECEALVQKGELADAADRLGKYIHARGGTELAHNRYRTLLGLLQDTPRLLQHGQMWLTVLLAQEKSKEAQRLYQECVKLDASFKPGAAETWFPLANMLQASDPVAALQLLKAFPSQFPKSKDVPKILLLAARILAERKQDFTTARRIVEQLQARYPEHALMPEIRAFAQRLPAA